MLIGEYTHTFDDKNRISLPSKFRKVMGAKVVVTPGLDGCLFLFTESEWRKISGKLSEESLLTADKRSFNRYMFGGATDTLVDSAGRILIPDFLKDRAKLSEKVVLVGVSSRVEIWNESAWKSIKRVFEKEADKLAEKLGEVGVL